MAGRCRAAGLPRLGRARGGELTSARLFGLIGLAAVVSGIAFWHFTRAPAGPSIGTFEPDVSPGVLYAATFTDAAGTRRSLGEFAGKVVVVNFWATWCAPCRAEMPAFGRLQSRWADREVRFLGLSAEAPELSARFAREVAVSYPLWTGGAEVTELSRRLGNRLGVLPHTVILGRQGQVLEQKVGPYNEDELDRLLGAIVSKSG